jgi:hypothetical protein
VYTNGLLPRPDPHSVVVIYLLYSMNSTDIKIERIVTRRELTDNERADNLRYWLSRPPAERVAEVERLRRLYYETIPRLERTVNVIPLARH